MQSAFKAIMPVLNDDVRVAKFGPGGANLIIGLRRPCSLRKRRLVSLGSRMYSPGNGQELHIYSIIGLRQACSLHSLNASIGLSGGGIGRRRSDPTTPIDGAELILSDCDNNHAA